ncbi:MAG: hypothetical protein OSJ44_15435 [Lachnospiraceae bacterium]|jgi:hypothetical protein|nr:hypothetical protein [Lachnospiraceae bacterium]MCX4321083.1 hypothetical protein [Lachnospiraceae bacterium]
MDSAENRIHAGSHRSATFVVNVYSQENSTWQGRIMWAENKESRMFRSALEMIKLIDGALENEST